MTAPKARKVNHRERLFVEQYLIDHCGTKAMVRAGFTGRRPDVAASKMLAKPHVAEFLQHRIDDKLRGAGVRADRVLQEFAAIAFSDARGLFDEHGNLKPPSEWDDAAAASVSAIEVEELWEGRGEARERTGNLHKVKRWDKVAALTALAKYLKLWVERSELSGPGGVPLAPPVVNIGFANGGPGEDPNTRPEGPGPVLRP